jgi:hypothetical protein
VRKRLQEFDLRASIAEGKKKLEGPQRTHFWMAFEVVHCAVLLAALVMLFVYVMELNSKARLNHLFNVYDAGGCRALGDVASAGGCTGRHCTATWQRIRGILHLPARSRL